MEAHVARRPRRLAGLEPNSPTARELPGRQVRAALACASVGRAGRVRGRVRVRVRALRLGPPRPGPRPRRPLALSPPAPRPPCPLALLAARSPTPALRSGRAGPPCTLPPVALWHCPLAAGRVGAPVPPRRPGRPAPALPRLTRTNVPVLNPYRTAALRPRHSQPRHPCPGASVPPRPRHLAWPVRHLRMPPYGL